MGPRIVIAVVILVVASLHFIRPEYAPPVIRGPTSLRVLTQNVWFGDLQWVARARALIQEIITRMPDVVCFQEVRILFLHELLASPLAALYTFSDGTGATLGPYGVLVLLRKPHTFLGVDVVPLPSTMGRSLLCCRVAIAGVRDVIVATVHLESHRNNAPARAAQLQAIFSALEERAMALEPAAILLMGDFNLCGTWSDENSNIPWTRWVDSWPAVRGPHDPGWTEDSMINKMMSETHQVRVDRVLFYKACDRFSIQAAELVGVAAIDDSAHLWISDHFGLQIDFQS